MAARDWYCEDVLSGKTKVQVIWEDPRVLAFFSPRPASRIHAIVVPKQHITSILEPEAANGALLESMVLAVQKIASYTGIDRTGLFVRTNAAGPDITPHMHWHVQSLD